MGKKERELAKAGYIFRGGRLIFRVPREIQAQVDKHIRDFLSKLPRKG